MSFDKQLKGQTRISGAMVAIDGIKIAAAILNCFSQQQGKEMMAALQGQDLPLAEKIQSQLFVFDDFAEVDDRSMQTLIAKIPRESLNLALRGITGACLQKFSTNMSANAAAMLKEELDNAPAKALSEIEKVRKSVIDVARQLEATQRIILKDDGLYI
ncbi:FliG C-terminal domain-containing protein [Thalassomonas sp. RHCl1]|uniref:FliG C-terminal domain-containing protein n=1 Tax=Thalassomonas sp. RHCl1 TaxID=2995320 RepID=UPI00248C58FC|nr:FliG C-terminal domain-containing protein [Thalassomonas sp. RHCl1]